MNYLKTDYMVIGVPGHDLHTDKKVFEDTNKYRYLGVKITSDGRD